MTGENLVNTLHILIMIVAAIMWLIEQFPTLYRLSESTSPLPL
jgi:hypothetical protein